MLQKALSSVKDWPESIANAWIDFERDEGTLEQVEFCEAKMKEKLDEVMEERQKMQQNAPLNELSMINKKANKRKLMSDDVGKWKNLEIFSSKIVKTDVQVKSKLRKSHLNTDGRTANDKNQEESKQKITPPPGFKTIKDKDTDDKDSGHEVDNNITVFISNLDYTATEDEVKTALKSVGPITLLKMIKDYKGRSKGYCYVQLSSVVCIILLINK